MARPRSTGKNTSFGKRSDAEKSFRKNKRDSSRSESSERKDERHPSRFSKSSSGEFRSSGPRFRGKYDAKKSFSRRGDDSERPGYSKSRGFGRNNEESYSERSSRFSKAPDRKKSFSGEKSFRKREGDTTERPRYSKSSGERNFGEEKSFKKRRGDSYEERKSKPYSSREEGSSKRFSKPAFKKENKDRVNPDRRGNFARGYERKAPEKKSFNKDEERKSFVQSRIEKQRAYERTSTPETKSGNPDLIRLNKFISNSGVCSRREADELIAMGLVSVNGTTITEMGFKVKPTDEVRYEGKKLKAEKPVYVLLNKPKGFITTTEDPEDRNTVMSLVSGACKERIYPVGRLDRNTTGLLLLTNDGDLADKLTHPSYNAKKIYKVELDKPLTKNDFQRIVDGVHLEEGKAIVDDVAIVSDDGKTIGIEIHIGWNRIVRRIFETLGYEVQKLDRVVYAGLDKKDLKRGQWRFLKSEEIVRLKHFK